MIINPNDNDVMIDMIIKKESLNKNRRNKKLNKLNNKKYKNEENYSNIYSNYSDFLMTSVIIATDKMKILKKTEEIIVLLIVLK